MGYILIVDDEENNRDILSRRLQRRDYATLEAASAKEAFDIVNSHTIDLILLDIRMPEMDGNEFLALLRKSYNAEQLPVIMVTAEDAPETMLKSFNLGADDYITKPVDIHVLTARVKNKLQQREAFYSYKQKTNLLHKIIPHTTVDELIRQKGKVAPQHFDLVSVLFTDFKDFTHYAKSVAPSTLVQDLNDYFELIDEIVLRHNIEKIKTIGDSYMCAGGVPIANTTNPIDVVRAALKIQEEVALLNNKRVNKGKKALVLRIGIHTGPLVAGVVGKAKYAYDIWGDTVNIAHRLESKGEINRVNISESTYKFIKPYFQCTYRGEYEIKNIGKLKMYFVNKPV